MDNTNSRDGEMGAFQGQWMPRRFRVYRNLQTDRRGVTAVEYGIMAALMAAVVGLAMSHVGQALVGMWQDVTAALPQDGPTTPGQIRNR